MPHIKYTPELLDKIVSKSLSIREVLGYLGKKNSGSAFSHIKKLLLKYKIDCSHFLGRGTNRGVNHKGGNKKKPWEEILIKRNNGTRVKAVILRRALIESGRTYKCEGENCQIENTWLNKVILLQVDHLDGDFTNCVKENLKFLCPNCHSQTETFGIKNYKFIKKIKKNYIRKKDRSIKNCNICNTQIPFKNKINLCKNCLKKLPRVNKRNINYPNKEQLSELIGEIPMTEIGKKYGVSDNAVKKWARKFEIPTPKNLGFWTKSKPVPPKEELESKLSDYSLGDLSEFYKVSKKTVNKWVRAYQLTLPNAKLRTIRHWKKRKLKIF